MKKIIIAGICGLCLMAAAAVSTGVTSPVVGGAGSYIQTVL